MKSIDGLVNYRYCGHGVILGKSVRVWQDSAYILAYYGNNAAKARKRYESFVRDGVQQGRREHLTGGGLIRSLGGWTEAKQALNGNADSHLMSDERILGDTDFVDSVLSQCGVQYERRQKLKLQGFDLKRIAARVAELLEIEPEEVFSSGRQDRKVRARSLCCFWAAKELGMSHTELARIFGMSPAGIGFSVERGETIAKQKHYVLTREVI